MLRFGREISAIKQTTEVADRLQTAVFIQLQYEFHAQILHFLHLPLKEPRASDIIVADSAVCHQRTALLLCLQFTSQAAERHGTT